MLFSCVCKNILYNGLRFSSDFIHVHAGVESFWKAWYNMNYKVTSVEATFLFNNSGKLFVDFVIEEFDMFIRAVDATGP